MIEMFAKTTRTPEADDSFFQRMNLSVSGVFLWSQL